MEEKAARFCLQFNLDDPVQRRAYEEIAKQGRRKSLFISKAVDFYLSHSGDSSPMPDKGKLRETVKEIMKELLDEGVYDREEPEALDEEAEEENGLAMSLLDGLDAFDE